jgi:hypothetical protein
LQISFVYCYIIVLQLPQEVTMFFAGLTNSARILNNEARVDSLYAQESPLQRLIMLEILMLDEYMSMRSPCTDPFTSTRPIPSAPVPAPSPKPGTLTNK